MIDPTFFTSSLPEDPTRFDSKSAQSWIPKWSNVKHIYDALSNFLVEDCDQHLPLFRNASGTLSHPDLKAIAQNASSSDALILLKLCVVAAANCGERVSFLTGMQELSGGVQRVLMETLQEAQNAQPSQPGSVSGQEYEEDYEHEESIAGEESYEDHSIPDDSHDARTLPTGATTSDLAYEERLAKVIADSQKLVHEKFGLQRHIDELNARYGTLQERYNRLQDELGESNSRLSAVLSGRTGEEGKSMQAKNETLINSLESRVLEYEGDLEGLRKQNEVLKIKAERVQKLQDDYDEIKIERDNLSRKANTAEKYRLKLEASQELEKENASLKTKVGDLQSQLRTSDTKTASSSNLAREVEEYRRMLPAIEQDRHELNEMKKRVEFEFHMLQARYSELEEQNRRSRQEVEDLQGRLRELDETTEVRPAPVTTAEVDKVDEADSETEEADFAAAEARLAEALQKSEAVTTSGNDGDSKPAVPGLDLTGLDTENGISEDELRSIMSAMRAQMAAGASAERETGVKMQKRMVIMLEKVRTRNIALVEQIRKQSDIISDLEKRPEISTETQPQKKSKREGMEESELEQQLDEQDFLIENLRREIRLVCSAWYEQNQRLATLGAGGGGGGAVALMRLRNRNGIEEPKSFLGRQRSMAEKVMLGGGVKNGSS